MAAGACAPATPISGTLVLVGLAKRFGDAVAVAGNLTVGADVLNATNSPLGNSTTAVLLGGRDVFNKM